MGPAHDIPGEALRSAIRAMLLLILCARDSQIGVEAEAQRRTLQDQKPRLDEGGGEAIDAHGRRRMRLQIMDGLFKALSREQISGSRDDEADAERQSGRVGGSSCGHGLAPGVHGFNQDQINTRLSQVIRMPPMFLFQRPWIRDESGLIAIFKGRHRARHPTAFRVRTRARQLDSLGGEFGILITQERVLVLGSFEGSPLSTECIGGDDIGSGFSILAMDLADLIGAFEERSCRPERRIAGVPPTFDFRSRGAIEKQGRSFS